MREAPRLLPSWRPRKASSSGPPCPKQREPGGDRPLSSPSTCPHATSKDVPACGPCRSAVPAEMLAQKTWLSIRGARAVPERSGEGCGGRQAAGRSEVRDLNAWAGGKRSAFQRLPEAAPSFLPSSLPLSFSFQSSWLPLFLIPAQPPSCLPDPRPSPPPAVTSKPKDKTRPPVRGYLRAPKRPRGPPRSLQEPRRALSRRPPHPRASERPRRQLLLLWGPQAEALPGRPQPARSGDNGVNARYSHSRAAARSPGSAGLSPAPIGGGGVGGAEATNRAFRVPSG